MLAAVSMEETIEGEGLEPSLVYGWKALKEPRVSSRLASKESKEFSGEKGESIFSRVKLGENRGGYGGREGSFRGERRENGGKEKKKKRLGLEARGRRRYFWKGRTEGFFLGGPKRFLRGRGFLRRRPRKTEEVSGEQGDSILTEGLWRDFPKQPAVFELAVFVRSEDLGKKAWLRGDESEVDEFLDMRILNRLWGFLPLPKNRGAHCSPRHVETRLGSSQLFWSAEPLFENPVAWDATASEVFSVLHLAALLNQADIAFILMESGTSLECQSTKRKSSLENLELEKTDSITSCIFNATNSAACDTLELSHGSKQEVMVIFSSLWASELAIVFLMILLLLASIRSTASWIPLAFKRPWCQLQHPWKQIRIPWNEGEGAAASTDQIESPHEENAREKRKSGSSKTDVPLLLDLQVEEIKYVLEEKTIQRIELLNQLLSVLRISKDDGGHANRGWKSEDEKLSCGYSSFREKRASLEGFYDVKISMVDGLTKSEPQVHHDLKLANILLDRNYGNKISDVGLVRLVPPSVADNVTHYRMKSTNGTFCYIDPEYQQAGMLGIKSDVLDPIVSDWPLEEALSFAKIALQCVELRRKDGPDLGKAVLPELNRMREFSEELLDPQARPVLHGHLIAFVIAAQGGLNSNPFSISFLLYFQPLTSSWARMVKASASFGNQHPELGEGWGMVGSD
ncbi:U-box domain-containing protein 34 [Vitis vinifera]|uniref:RING-type E3 ubiquitin transferase n=1 Tax=Vitis vinifera TaxID=29760 RepID=A0A438EQD1_VITVI|nr:U-box domain-containing protein 34 [Vitis vinifera]